tara:strand:+ start:2094 stop:2882 length:789 start_codon:yes stop_codon:yes gene_type:complete
MLTRSYFDVPVVGRVYLLQTTYLSNNGKNTTETTNIETRFFGFIAGLVSDLEDTAGTLVDDKGQVWDYNINDKEYWKPSDMIEDESENKDEKPRKIQFTIGSDSESSSEYNIISVSRIGNEEIETIHGFRTNKWTTTLEFSEFKWIVDEWSVEELSVLHLADSLNKQVLIRQGISDTLIAISKYGSGLSNNEMILGATNLDSIYRVHGIAQIPGEIIKGNVKKFENDEDDPTVSFGIEMLELYVEDYDEKRFLIPDDYEFLD